MAATLSAPASHGQLIEVNRWDGVVNQAEWTYIARPAALRSGAPSRSSASNTRSQPKYESSARHYRGMCAFSASRFFKVGSKTAFVSVLLGMGTGSFQA